jgi:uncharacterized protein
LKNEKMKQTKTAAKRTKTAPPPKSRRWRLWVTAPILLALVAGSVFFMVYAVRHSHIERGQFNISDTYIGENLAHSLDLKLAARASYPSAPIVTTADLGTADGLHRQVFKYLVKDDNLTEYGLMITPQTPAPPKGYPVIILLHGYITPRRYKTATDYLAESLFYASHGFLVVKPDLRGQGDSINQGFADSAYYSMSYNTDVLSLVSALRQSSYVDKSSINLWGHSMGAYIALRAAVLSKNVNDVILLSGPMDSLEEMYLTYIPPSDENNPYALATRSEIFARYGTPADNRAFWQDASPINFVSKIRGTVQINVGLQDAVVPPRFSADLNDAMNQAGVKHRYFVYLDGNHSLDGQRPDIYAHSLQILETKPSA